MADLPDWYLQAHANRGDSNACLSFTKKFLSAPAYEREGIMQAWEVGDEWALPHPWRLACLDESPGTVIERIRTDLLFQALNDSGQDDRDTIMGLAVNHNSCQLAGIDPKPLFKEVARAVGGRVATVITSFATRDPELQSMEVFLLEAFENPGGGFKLRSLW